MSAERTTRRDDFFEDDEITAPLNDKKGVREVVAELVQGSTLAGQLEIKERFAAGVLEANKFPSKLTELRRKIGKYESKIVRLQGVTQSRKVSPVVRDALNVLERAEDMRRHLAVSKDGKYLESVVVEGIRLGDDYRRLRTRATLTRSRKHKKSTYSTEQIDLVRKLWKQSRRGPGRLSDTPRAEHISKKAAALGVKMAYKRVLHYCEDLRQNPPK